MGRSDYTISRRGIRRLDYNEGTYTSEMYSAIPSFGTCLFLLTFYSSLPYASPKPQTFWNWNLYSAPPSSNSRSSNDLSVIRRASSEIIPSGGEGLDEVRGTVFLEETSEGVFISGDIDGLKPGLHGFHVHQEGNLDKNCKASKGHFNPEGNSHSAPTSAKRHVGDLGNVVTDRFGETHVNMVDDVITLDPASENSVANRAFVVHLGEDDLGIPGLRDGNGGSLKTGNAGSRVACGIITPNPSK